MLIKPNLVFTGMWFIDCSWMLMHVSHYGTKNCLVQTCIVKMEPQSILHYLINFWQSWHSIGYPSDGLGWQYLQLYNCDIYTLQCTELLQSSTLYTIEKFYLSINSNCNHGADHNHKCHNVPYEVNFICTVGASTHIARPATVVALFSDLHY